MKIELTQQQQDVLETVLDQLLWNMRWNGEEDFGDIQNGDDPRLDEVQEILNKLR